MERMMCHLESCCVTTRNYDRNTCECGFLNEVAAHGMPRFTWVSPPRPVHPPVGPAVIMNEQTFQAFLRGLSERARNLDMSTFDQ